MTNYTENAVLYERHMQVMGIDSSGDSCLLECIKKLKPKRIHEVGCGTGILTRKVAELGYDLTASDINQNFIDYAKKKCPNIKFEKYDAVKTPLDKFDVVYCRFVYHHIKDKDKIKFLKNLSKAKSIIILDYFIPEGKDGLKRYHKYRLELFKKDPELIKLEKDTMNIAFKGKEEYKNSIKDFGKQLKDAHLEVKFHKLITHRLVSNTELFGLHLFVLGEER